MDEPNLTLCALQMRAEEAEFNAARRGLANIDLQTPIAWAPTQPQPYNPSAYARR